MIAMSRRRWVTVMAVAVVVAASFLAAFGLASLLGDTKNPQTIFTIKLDKYVYYSGDWMNITITNVSNETLWFEDTGYGLDYFRWNGSGWEFYCGVAGCHMIIHLKPGETGHVRWHLGGYPSAPFPPGRYRIGHKRYQVYTEFIVEEKPS
jgi:hypothetical protein